MRPPSPSPARRPSPARALSWASVLGYTGITVVFYLRYHREFGVVLRDFWWTVGVGRLEPSAGIPLPTRLTVSRQDTRLKLVVTGWSHAP